MYKIMVKEASGKVRDTSREDLKAIRKEDKELLQAFVDGLNYSRERRKNSKNRFVVVEDVSEEKKAEPPKKEDEKKEEPKKTEKKVSACVKKPDKKTVSKKVEDLPVKFPKPKDKKA